MGSPRLRLRHGRRLRRPPVLRRFHYFARAGGRRLPRGNPRPTRLPLLRRIPRVRQAAPRLPRDLGEYRQHGRALYRRQKAPFLRLLHPRRRDGQATRPRGHRLYQPHPRGVRRRARHPRRTGSLAPPLCALRLLGQQGAPLDPCGQPRRPLDLRHGRKHPSARGGTA